MPNQIMNRMQVSQGTSQLWTLVEIVEVVELVIAQKTFSVPY